MKTVACNAGRVLLLALMVLWPAASVKSQSILPITPVPTTQAASLGAAQIDELISTEDEPDHQALCDREQAFLLRAIREDLDLSLHLADAVNSLRIVLAADESVRRGEVVRL